MTHTFFTALLARIPRAPASWDAVSSERLPPPITDAPALPPFFPAFCGNENGLTRVLFPFNESETEQRERPLIRVTLSSPSSYDRVRFQLALAALYTPLDIFHKIAFLAQLRRADSARYANDADNLCDALSLSRRLRTDEMLAFTEGIPSPLIARFRDLGIYEKGVTALHLLRDALPPSGSEALSQFLARLPLNANTFSKIAGMLARLIAKEKCALADVLTCERATAILDDDAPPRVKADAFYAYVKARYLPRYTEVADAFTLEARTLEKKGVRITTDPAFEQETITVTFTARNENEWAKRIAHLADAPVGKIFTLLRSPHA